VGYRLIDTASVYENEEGVGRAIAEGSLPREEIFVTSKVWNDSHGFDNALRACEHTLQRLGLQYVDLYLIHWPVPHQGRYLDTWRALIRLREEGRARSIGVSNFSERLLQELIEETGVVPAVNQVELHPWFAQSELRAFHMRHGIVTQSWSPLAKGGELLREGVVLRIAEKHRSTPAQIVLRWHVDLGLSVIPKSAHRARLEENRSLMDIALDESDMREIASLDRGKRVGPDPETFG
jgi:2,5-diketo-D-gluconate reductase A